MKFTKLCLFWWRSVERFAFFWFLENLNISFLMSICRADFGKIHNLIFQKMRKCENHLRHVSQKTVFWWTLKSFLKKSHLRHRSRKQKNTEKYHICWFTRARFGYSKTHMFYEMLYVRCIFTKPVCPPSSSLLRYDFVETRLCVRGQLWFSTDPSCLVLLLLPVRRW